MQISNAPHGLYIDARILGYLFDMSDLEMRQMWLIHQEGRSFTHCSNSAFMLVPMTLLYTLRPITVFCRFDELTSKFQGLAQRTAAFN